MPKIWKNFIKNKKGNKILLGLTTASVLTVLAIVAVLCADPIKGTIKDVIADVDEKIKKYTLSFKYDKNQELNKDGVIYTVSHRGEVKENQLVKYM